MKCQYCRYPAGLVIEYPDQVDEEIVCVGCGEDAVAEAVEKGRTYVIHDINATEE